MKLKKNEPAPVCQWQEESEFSSAGQKLKQSKKFIITKFILFIFLTIIIITLLKILFSTQFYLNRWLFICGGAAAAFFIIYFFPKIEKKYSKIRLYDNKIVIIRGSKKTSLEFRQINAFKWAEKAHRKLIIFELKNSTRQIISVPEEKIKTKINQTLQNFGFKREN